MRKLSKLNLMDFVINEIFWLYLLESFETTLFIENILRFYHFISNIWYKISKVCRFWCKYILIFCTSSENFKISVLNHFESFLKVFWKFFDQLQNIVEVMRFYSTNGQLTKITPTLRKCRFIISLGKKAVKVLQNTL